MSGTHHTIILFLTALVTIAFTLHPVTCYADEADDIARLLELNDAYAEVSRAWRAKEITRAEMRERQQVIQTESRQINAGHGTTGSAERRAWDRKVQQAKTAYARQKRRDAQAAKADLAAEQRGVREAEKAEAAAVVAEEARVRLERDARLTAELRLQMQEDLIDTQTGWIAYDGVDQTIQDRHRELVQTWSRSDQSEQFNRLVFEHFIGLLRQRSAMSTAERRSPLEAAGESAAVMAAERDAAPWVAEQPRAAEVIAAYPGDDPQSAARRATALSLMVQWFPQVPEWSRKSLKAILLESEYHQALYELDRLYPTNSAQRSTYEQSRVAWRQDGEFVREVAEAFRPEEAARQNTAEEWHRIREESDFLGRRVAVGLAVVLTVVVLIWAVLSMLQTARGGGFEASEVDGRLDVVYSRNKHGILALLAAALVWGLLVTIIVVFIMPDEEPQFLKNFVLRDPSNAALISFTLYFLIFGVPAAGLVVLNLFRLGTKRFCLTPAGVIVGDKTYLLPEEQCYFVEAPDTGPERTVAQQSGGVFFIGSGPAVAAAMAGAALGRGMRAGQQAAHGIGRLLALAIARMRYSIGFAHQGGTDVLARGLSERRANAILDRIGEYLNAESLNDDH